ncbi:Protein of unknown function [Pyronema omphalodes CBS 100304]|uniref:Uncharacterized protein n=1 Tax=Pyronema omphalodes (strain CBS 100304) TaxID=1076935 RepID=U4KYV3_PYROM|nr:Protein of unknown function [Pyronema omphalodes CBS 100304]
MIVSCRPGSPSYVTGQAALMQGPAYLEYLEYLEEHSAGIAGGLNGETGWKLQAGKVFCFMRGDFR